MSSFQQAYGHINVRPRPSLSHRPVSRRHSTPDEDRFEDLGPVEEPEAAEPRPEERDSEEPPAPEFRMPRESPNNPFQVPNRSREGSQSRSGSRRSEHRNEEAPPSDIVRLAEVLERLTRKTSSSPPPRSVKVRKPDPFDGSDPQKLNTFLLQCQLAFRTDTRSFSRGQDKVSFALSYLKGTALDWFEPAIMRGEDPEWIDDWDIFVEELQSNFGVFDPEGDAESKLQTLTMRDDKPCAKYLAEFNRLASRVQWSESALCFLLYKGLPARLKDKISESPSGKPKTLAGMRRLIQLYDRRYWERQEEIRRERGSQPKASSSQNSGSRSNNSGGSSNNASSSGNGNQAMKSSSSNNQAKGSNSGGRNDTPNPRANSTPRPGNSSSGNNSTADRAKAMGLDKNGKLTPEERKRRFENNLCMFCAKPGHKARDCTNPASTASQAKARSATTTSSATPQSSESKA